MKYDCKKKKTDSLYESKLNALKRLYKGKSLKNSKMKSIC